MKTPKLMDVVRLLPARDLSRAAKALGLTPEALVRRIDSFESALGTKLFDSAAKALKPGEAGRIVIDHASRIFSQARDFTRDLEELAGLQAPEIAFGTDMFVAELPLGVALGRMATANSRLRVNATVGDFEELTKAVLAGKLEFCVADTTGAERHPTRLRIEPLGEHRMFFFVRQGHPLTTTSEISLETLLVFPLAATRIPHRIAMHIAKLMPVARVDRDTGDISPSLKLDSFAVVKSAVAAGDAIGLAPLGAIESEVRSGKLAIVPYDAPWLQTSYGVFHNRKRSLSRAAQLFVTQLRQVGEDIQAREQRAIARMDLKQRPRRKAGGSRASVAKTRAGRKARARSPSRRR